MFEPLPAELGSNCASAGRCRNRLSPCARVLFDLNMLDRTLCTRHAAPNTCQTPCTAALARARPHRTACARASPTPLARAAAVPARRPLPLHLSIVCHQDSHQSSSMRSPLPAHLARVSGCDRAARPQTRSTCCSTSGGRRRHAASSTWTWRPAAYPVLPSSVTRRAAQRRAAQQRAAPAPHCSS